MKNFSKLKIAFIIPPLFLTYLMQRQLPSKGGETPAVQIFSLDWIMAKHNQKRPCERKLFVGPGLTEFQIDRIAFWSSWTYLFKHTKRTPFVKPRGFGQSEIRSIRCLPSSLPFTTWHTRLEAQDLMSTTNYRVSKLCYANIKYALLKEVTWLKSSNQRALF